MLDAQDLVEVDHVQHHAAVQRHALPIIRCAATARRDGDAMLHRRADRPRHFILVARRDHDLGHMARQFATQKGADDELVATLATQGHGIRREGNAAQIIAEGCDRMHKERSGARRAW